MPMIISKDEWSRILKWTDPNKEDPLAIKRREQLKLMNARSDAMTREWPNSVQNVNKRNEEVRRERIAAAQQANQDFYKRYVKRKRAEQERRLFEARDTVFKNKDAPKLLLSAVIETAILKERDEQIKFNKGLRARMAAEEHKGDADIALKAQQFEQLQQERKRRRFDVNKQNQLEILEQAKEVAERNRREHESELKMQIIDNQKAKEEIDALKEFDENYKAAERARIFADMEQASRDLEARRKEVAARDKLDDRLIEVLNNSKARVEAKRKQVEKEVKDERTRVLDEIRNKLETGDAARDALEQAIIDKAQKEREDTAKARLEAEASKRARLVAERVAEHQRHLRAEEARLRDLETKRQWEVMNRFKNMEIYEDFKEKERAAKEQKVKEYREEILKLMEERAKREAASVAETRHHYGEVAARAQRDADNRLLTHAHALLQEAHEHARPTRPLERALHRYCAMNRLYPLPPLYKSMRDALGDYSPRDASRPDADYAPPAPPAAPATATSHLDSHDHSHHSHEDHSHAGAIPVPEYHQHGQPFPTLLHPDTDCFDEACETGACHCEHMQ